MAYKTTITDPNEDLITITDFKITSADTDIEARLRPGALFSFLAHAAYLSADNLGFGYRHLKGHNLFWVLSRLEIHLKRPLMWNEVVEIETWPKDINGILYIRDFIGRDERGDIVVKAGSAWLAIDSETKRPKRKESFSSDIFNRLNDKHALAELPQKLPEISGDDSFEVHSTYFDLDLNKHVTSSRYVDWMMDTFTVDFHKKNYPSLLTVNYVKETMADSDIEIFRKNEGQSDFYFMGRQTESLKTSFRGRIKF